MSAVATPAKRGQKGQYVLLGSASPSLIRHISESLGRNVTAIPAKMVLRDPQGVEAGS
jgi:hypothetical protein